MSGFEITALITGGVAVMGVIYTLIKNSKSQARRDKEVAVKQAERDQRLSDNQEAILNRLNDDETGLTALNMRVQSFELNCKGISTGLTTRIKVAEEDILAIQGKAKHRRQ